MGDGQNIPVGGYKTRLLFRVTCQQEDADSDLIKDSSTQEQALPPEYLYAGVAQCNSQTLFPESKRVEYTLCIIVPFAWFCERNL